MGEGHLNEETRDVYMFIFEDQIRSKNPLSKKDVENINSRTFLGQKLEESQQLLSFIEYSKVDYNKNSMPEVEMRIKQLMYPKEFNWFVNLYNFIRITSSQLPEFEKKKGIGV